MRYDLGISFSGGQLNGGCRGDDLLRVVSAAESNFGEHETTTCLAIEDWQYT